jgi:putative DNA primase/helicase
MSTATVQPADHPTCPGAAWEYAERGLQVIPLQGIRNGKCTCQEWRDKNGKGTCGTPGKHPRFRNWPERATTDAMEIEKWYSHDFKGSNVGIATGAASGIFVLDVDPKNGGDESLDSLFAKHGRLPDTLQAITGSGGRHYYFKHPGGTVPNEVCILPGLDIRGDGGQVVAAPSMHMSGRRYAWDGLDGFNAPILPAPEWLLDLMFRKEPKRNGRGKGKVVPIGKAVPEGQRNATLARLAGVARRKGSSVEAINAYLQAENRDRCNPPLPEDEVRQIAESVSKYVPEENAPVDSGGADGANWRDSLIVNRDGNPKPILANAITALRLSP